MARSWITPQADGGVGYTVYWIDPAKRQRQRSFFKKVDAEAFSTKKARELDTGTYIEPKLGAELVTSLFERWATTRGLESSSVRQYLSMLNTTIKPYFKTRTIGPLKTADVQAWILWMRDTKKYSATTIQIRFGYLSSALQWAVDNEELGRNPAKRAKLPGKRANVRRKAKGTIVVPTLAEIEALIACFDPRYVAMVWLMAGCGLRIAEAMGLCLEQIDFRKGLLHVDRQVTEDGETDSGKNAGLRLKPYTKHRDVETPGRTVPLPAIVAAVLKAHLKKYGTVGPHKLLFPNASRTGLVYQYYIRYQIWHPAIKASKASFHKTHALRHFFAASMLSNGVPITDLSEWLGHSSIEITYEYYGHLTPDAPERGRAAIDLAMASLAPQTAQAGPSAVRTEGLESPAVAVVAEAVIGRAPAQRDPEDARAVLPEAATV
ncbi:site-specific integrase [Longispora sp. NPDC051575]|uniref:tyrosine-type recombinase/integrase n=1 Tax=Longispora sp. NPDC051575 TaxID=3154943 RepID=UPI00342B598D